MSRVYWQTRWHKQCDGTQPPEGTRALWTIGPSGCDWQAGIQRAQPLKAIWDTFIRSFCCWSGQLPPASSMEQCAPGNTSQDRFTNKTRRMTRPHGSEPNTLYKGGNTGRNWVCSRSPISLDLALWHWTKLQSTSIIALEVNSEWSLEHGGCDWERASPTGPKQWMYCCFFLFCFP